MQTIYSDLSQNDLVFLNVIKEAPRRENYDVNVKRLQDKEMNSVNDTSMNIVGNQLEACI